MERCFNIVASVDGALVIQSLFHAVEVCSCRRGCPTLEVVVKVTYVVVINFNYRYQYYYHQQTKSHLQYEQKLCTSVLSFVGCRVAVWRPACIALAVIACGCSSFCFRSPSLWSSRTAARFCSAANCWSMSSRW